jgi:hypothetical protein
LPSLYRFSLKLKDFNNWNSQAPRDLCEISGIIGFALKYGTHLPIRQISKRSN